MHIKDSVYLTCQQSKCIETFKECKKKEDKSVESVYYCMDDHSMKFINQTTESLGMKVWLCITFRKSHFVYSKCCRQEFQDSRGEKNLRGQKSTAT